MILARLRRETFHEPNLILAPWKGIRIPECENAKMFARKIRNPQKILLAESGIMSFGIWNPSLGIRNPTNDCNPESTSTE